MLRDKFAGNDAHCGKMICVHGQRRTAVLIHPMAQKIDFVLIIMAINQRIFWRICRLHHNINDIGFAHNSDDDFVHVMLPR